MKRLVVKDWFWQKIAREHDTPRVWGGNVDVVFQETEKAYKVMMGAVNHTICTWIPKTLCEWVETDHESLQTRVVNSYEEAMTVVTDIRRTFR